MDEYAAALREAILEAEAEERREPNDARRFYAIGLRVAAGLYGMPEGIDPETRARRLPILPMCPSCRIRHGLPIHYDA